MVLMALVTSGMIYERTEKTKSGKTPLAKITTRMNSTNYVEMLDDIFIPFSEDYMDG